MTAIITSALAVTGLFFILLDAFNVPYNATFKSVAGMSKNLEGDSSQINTSLEALAIWISKLIRLDDYRKATMTADLRAARMDITPEMFLANCMVKALVVGVFAIPGFILMPWLGVVILLTAVVYYYNETKSLAAKVAAQRQAIEYELSNFVASIEKTLRHNRDVLQMMESYEEIAGPEMKNELQITIADMKSGNYETAITRLETRIGSVMVSDVCRGLISIIRGDETTAYWQSLEIKFEDYRREGLKARASKIPGKVSRLSMVILITFMFVWLIVITTQVITTLSGMFY